ncbi:MAG: type II toxin-antitoxin system HipA family toxin [Pseudolabrys sp.]
MTSETGPTEAFVWVWLPGAATPVVAGRLAPERDGIVFNYGRSYLARKNAIPLYEPELPLRAGILPLLNGLQMPNCIRDASPDAWGRRVIINRKLGAGGRQVDAAEFDELTYLLKSGSDRIGALDFQRSSREYVAREAPNASLDELMNAASRVENGIPLSPDLDAALLHGSSIGGARPKALIEATDKKYVAKFSAQSDLYNVVKAEYIAMRLAAIVGINAAPVSLQRAANKDVLLIERFDRAGSDSGWQRKPMVSALTLLALDEMMARYASYEALATVIRQRFARPKDTLRELFSRMLFNILCGNTDDHARNHSAFWDGTRLSLTPAYDICPQARAGGEASQAMLIVGDERASRISSCLKAAHLFHLSKDAALSIAQHQIKTIKDRWATVCDEAKLSEVDRSLLWQRQFLNAFAFEEAPPELVAIID